MASTLLGGLSAIWTWYLRHLVYYDTPSWIAKAARTFRVLAFLLVAPFALLMLLDVTSYLIARTLGLVDAAHALTADSQPFWPEQNHEHEDTPTLSRSAAVPTILVSDTSSDGVLPDESLPGPDAPAQEVAAARVHEDRLRDAAHVAPVARRPPPAGMPYFFTPHEEHSMALSGVGVFSPAATRPSSPVIERKSILADSARSRIALGDSSMNLASVAQELEAEGADSERHGLRKRAPPPSQVDKNGR